MYKCDRDYIKSKCNDTESKITIRRQCAYSDLIAGDSFSDCEHCIWCDGNIDVFYFGDTPMCNRYDDLCVE